MTDIVRRAASNLVRSKAFLDTFTELVAAELERQLRNEAGGNSVYISKTCCNADKESRNELIRSRFTGGNYAELSRQSGLSSRQIRNICKK